MLEEREKCAVDWSILDGFREYQVPGKPDLVDALISTFVTSTTQLLSELERAISSGDYVSLKATAHSLKSSSAGIGGNGMSGICRDLESLTEEKRNIAATLLEKLRAEYARVQTELTGKKGR